MTFRGAANGDEAPIRIIQGPKTGLRQFDKLSVDPVNDEVIRLVRQLGGVLRPQGQRRRRAEADPGRAEQPAQHAQVEVDNLQSADRRRRRHDFDLRPDRVGRHAAEGSSPACASATACPIYPPTGMILINVPGARDDERDETEPFSPEALASDKVHSASGASTTTATCRRGGPSPDRRTCCASRAASCSTRRTRPSSSATSS